MKTTNRKLIIMKKFKTKVGLGPLYRPFASLCAVSLAALGFLGGALQIRAASIDTWVGNTDANFSTVANWTYSSGSGPAASGDSWVFGAAGTAGTTLTDDVGTGTSFNVTNITFNAGAPAYTILNNGFVNNYTLRGNITNNSTSLQTINDVITLAGSRTVLTTAGGGNVTFGNCIKSSTLIVAGAGTVTLSGNTTDNANLNPDVQTNATCVLAKTLAGIGAAANATVENGGTLRLGAGNGREIYILTTINSGGVFDLNGFGEGTNSQGGAYIKVAGTGISSGGALVNNNTTSIGTYTKPVSLTGNTSMGGAGYLNLLGSVTNGSSYSITHAGAGILRLAGTNSYSGGTVCSVGTVQFGKTNSMPASGTVAISGATLAVNVGGSGEWTTNASGNGTIAGLLAGLGGQSGSVVTWTGNCSLGLDTSSDAFGLTYSGNIADLSSPLGFVKLGANTLAFRQQYLLRQHHGQWRHAGADPGLQGHRGGFRERCVRTGCFAECSGHYLAVVFPYFGQHRQHYPAIHKSSFHHGSRIDRHESDGQRLGVVYLCLYQFTDSVAGAISAHQIYRQYRRQWVRCL